GNGREGLHADPADLVRELLGEPHGAVGTRRDARWKAACGRNIDFGDRAARRDPPDLVRKPLGKPERPVRPGRDAAGNAGWRWNGEDGERSGRRDPADLVAAGVREPERAIGSGGNPVRSVQAWRQRKLRRAAGR